MSTAHRRCPNASFNYTSGPYQVRFFGRNLQNTDYVFIRSPGFGYQEYGGQPRIYGVEVAAKF
jgi:iron complex outermembrane receptor protein